MVARITLEQANYWLKENKLDKQYKIINWPSKALDKTEFLNLKRNRRFFCVFSSFKTQLKNNPAKEFGLTNEEIQENKKQTCLGKYGVDHPNKSEEIRKKTIQTCKERYGTETPLQSKDIKEKILKTNLEKYGVENVSQAKQVKQKRKQTFRERYGVDHIMKTDFVKNKARETWVKKYGVDNPSKSVEVKKKKEKTNLQKYGTKTPCENEEIKNKLRQAKTKYLIKGKTLKEISTEKGCGYTTIQQKYHSHGPDFIEEYGAGKSEIEQIVEQLLRSVGVQYDANKSLGRYRPDFIVPEHKLIIECDGLYWHSDKVNKDKLYHKNKKQFYDSEEYNSLFFLEDEIKNKSEIVSSIILNKIGESKKIYARKTSCGLLSKQSAKRFFEKNHLMGAGTGRTYCLVYRGEIVCCLQARWKNKKERILEVARFCSKLNHSIVGGWSKLISLTIESERPNQIITFIDRRYGEGEYLENMGWTKESENLSFKWVSTSKKESYHRMKFPGNSGYEQGLAKIWDCGQAKWALNINSE